MLFNRSSKNFFPENQKDLRQRKKKFFDVDVISISLQRMFLHFYSESTLPKALLLIHYSRIKLL